jgi:hypothetical protein
MIVIFFHDRYCAELQVQKIQLHQALPANKKQVTTRRVVDIADDSAEV